MLNDIDVIDQERDAVTSSVKDIVDMQQEEQMAQNAALAYTAGHYLGSDMNAFAWAT